MTRLLRLRPSPAIMIACLALAVALGGTSYAAADKLLPKNSVGTKQVVNGSLQTVDLSKRAKAALKGARGLRGLQGAQGQRGPTGARGAQGIQGIPGLSSFELVEKDSANDSATPKILNLVCPGTKRAISVGADIGMGLGSVGFVAVTEAFITGNNAAVVRADEVGGGTASNWSLNANVACAAVQ
jgi:hypothetical protein